MKRQFVAVVGFKTLGGEAEKNAWAGVGVGEELATRLASDKERVATVERLQINTVLAARQGSAPMLTLGEENAERDRQCAEALRDATKEKKLYGADVLMLGTVLCGEKSLRATTRLVDVGTGVATQGVIAEAERTQAGLERDVQALSSDLTVKWCEKLGIPVSLAHRF